MKQEKLSVSNLDAISLQGKVLECKITVSDLEFLNLSNDDDFQYNLKKRMAEMLSLEIINSYAVFTKRENIDRFQTDFLARVILVPKEAPTQLFKDAEVRKALLKL